MHFCYFLAVQSRAHRAASPGGLPLSHEREPPGILGHPSSGPGGGKRRPGPSWGSRRSQPGPRGTVTTHRGLPVLVLLPCPRTLSGRDSCFTQPITTPELKKMEGTTYVEARDIVQQVGGQERLPRGKASLVSFITVISPEPRGSPVSGGASKARPRRVAPGPLPPRTQPFFRKSRPMCCPRPRPLRAVALPRLPYLF